MCLIVMKRIFVLMLALILCLPVMVSCNKEEPTEPPAPPAPSTDIKLIVSDVSEYQIVVSSDASEFEEDAAYDLRYVIKALTNVTIPVVEDTAPAQDKEIVVGVTNRKSLYQLPLDYYDGYVVCVVGERLVIEARSLSMMNTAMSTFVREQFGVSINSNNLDRQPDRNDVAIARDYLLYNDTAAVYQVIYDGSYMQKRYANLFLDSLKSIAYSNLVLLETEKNGDSPQIELIEDKNLERGAWRIEMGADKKSFKAYARDYYGFTAVAKYLKKMIKENDKNVYPLADFTTINGSYIDVLEKGEGASAYAYNKTEEYRVMFYNVLWGDPEPQERNGLAATMILEYMPDVIGFQEFNSTKRGGAKGIPSLLASAGYVETIDPKVENMKSVEDGGWGIGGGIKVERDDGSVYYTYYNCVPIFYNQNTTECIDSGYHWYQNQVDDANREVCGREDCASKSLTWGVFEAKATGERYIVVSTHMCTMSNDVRGLQAIEAVEVINELLKTYDYPVFFGGDFNGFPTQKNYIHFTSEEVGYLNISEKNLPTLHNSDCRTDHTDPVYDKKKEMLVVATYDTSGMPGGYKRSVDHIFLANEDSKQVDITVYGVILDDVSRIASDHFPIYVDFSIS